MSLRTINLRHEYDKNIIWAELTSPNMSIDLLHDIDGLSRSIESIVGYDKWADKPMFLVFYSKDPSIFNLGGDLKLFYRCLENGDHVGLEYYAHACTHAIYRLHLSWNLPITTIAMIEGQCYGGGFEGALACDYIFASDRASIGLPEPVFNLFPGMGAYSFLKQRVGQKQAEDMCTSGKSWSTEELRSEGIIDMVGSEGYVEILVRNFIEKKQKRHISTNAFRQIRRKDSQLDPTELRDIVNLWLDGIKKLSMKDKRMMYKLIRAQEKVNATE